MSHRQSAQHARKKLLPIIKTMLSIGLIVQTCQGMEPIKDETQKDCLRIPNTYSFMDEKDKTFNDDLKNFFASFHYATSINGVGTPTEGALTFFNTILPKFGFQSGNFDICIGSDILNKNKDVVRYSRELFSANYNTYLISIECLNSDENYLSILENYLKYAESSMDEIEVKGAKEKVQIAKDRVQNAKQDINDILHKFPVFAEITCTDDLERVMEKEFSSRKESLSYYFNPKNDESINIILPPVSYDLFGMILTTDVFSFEKERDTSLGIDVLKGLMKQFPGKKLTVSTLYNHNFYDRLGEFDDSHYCYSKIMLDTEGNQLSVSTFDPGEEFTKLERFVASEIYNKKTSDEESKELFQDVANQMGMNLDYSYICLDHQVHNDYDCGWFSTVYCLNDIQGINPLKLQPYDVYLGFKFLTEHGYDRIMLEDAQKSPDFEPENTISLIADATWRKFSNYMIDYLNEK